MNNNPINKQFYKYTSSETAKNILSTQKLRFSSPLIFNDPFDHQIDFEFPFSESELIKQIRNKIELIVFGNECINFNQSTLFGKSLSFLKKINKTLDKEETLNELIDSLNKNLGKFHKMQDTMNEELKRYLKDTRVFCVTTDKENLIMWSHYSNEHKGVVIELNCLKEVENSFHLLKPVKYTDKLPVMCDNINNFVEGMISGKVNYPIEALKNLSYTKSKAWAYEKEWRVSIAGNYENNNLYNDYKESPKIFNAVYFGCKIKEQDKNDILKLLVGELKNVQAYQCNKKIDSFGLNFKKL